MLDHFIYCMGLTMCVSGSLTILCISIIGTASLFNRAVRAALETYGGWKVFLEYRAWYNERIRATPATKEE